MSNAVNKLRREYHKQYGTIDFDFIVVSFMLLTNEYDTKKIIRKSKSVLLNMLLDNIPYEKIIESDDYYSTLNTINKNAIDTYRSVGSQLINEYMRDGKVTVHLYNVLPEYTFPISIKNDGSLDIKHSVTKTIMSASKKFLKQQGIDSAPKTIRLIKNTIREYPVKREPMLLFRGEESDVRPTLLSTKSTHYKNNSYSLSKLNLVNGSVFHNKSFTSFSFSPITALGFNNETPCCVYRFKYKPSSKLPYFIFPSSGLNEAEVLFPPTSFVVKRVSYIVSPLATDVKLKIYDIELVK